MTAVDHAELKPCPFCGGPAHIQFSKFELHSGFHVVCHGKKDCPLYCSDPYRAHDFKEQAASVWNVRAHEAALLSEIEGLKARIKCLEKLGGEQSLRVMEQATRAKDAENALATLRTQAPDSWRPDMEAVARVVDFQAWDFYDRHIGNPIMLAECKHEVGPSLAKADAILALRPQTAESGE